MGATTTHWGRAREAERGIADLALVLDGDVVGDALLSGGGLQRRRLPSSVVLDGGGDADNAGLDNERGITADAERRPAVGCIS